MNYPKSVYLANAMRGFEQYNFPWFDRAEKYLLDKGVHVLSPHTMDRELGFNEKEDPFTQADLESAVRRDVEALIRVKAIALGPDWDTSKGAWAERAVAEWLGREIWEVDPDADLFVPEGYAEGF